MIRVEVTGHAVPRLSRAQMAHFVRRCLRQLERGGAFAGEPSDLALKIVDDRAMIELNRRFRRKRKSTDVLTFPADASYSDPEQRFRHLGDMVISIDRARRQAAEQRHSLATEIRYLLLHGLIHALGYDHESDHGEMNALEMTIRGQVGLD